MRPAARRRRLMNAEPDGRSEELRMLRIRPYLTRRKFAGALGGFMRPLTTMMVFNSATLCRGCA